jgi:Tfp pilus assembly protein PilZ
VSLGSDTHYFTVQARDLSCGGLFVETYRALSLGEELSVEFELPAGRVVTRGVVCWVREAQHDGGSASSPGYGIAFREMSRFTRPLIESFCRGLPGIPSSRLMAG